MYLIVTMLALGAPPADGWKAQEAGHLREIRPLTADFVRAGEGYFSPDGKKVIFQAEEKGTGNPFYQIFVMDLESVLRIRTAFGCWCSLQRANSPRRWPRVLPLTVRTCLSNQPWYLVE